METLPAATGRHRSFGGGALVWSGNLSPEERRVHQVLAEVREGLDVARLAGATGLAKIALYSILEGLRLRGMVEAYPGSPVLFYASEGLGGRECDRPLSHSLPSRPVAQSPTAPPAPPALSAPWSPVGSPAAAAPEGSICLVWEAQPGRSLAGYRARVRAGAPGLLIGRSPPSAEPGARLSLGEIGPPPRAERLDEIVRAVRQAGPGAAVLLDGLEYLVAKHGFDSVLRMVFHLRELAALNGCVLFVPADPRAFEPRQKALLEREARVL